MTTLEPRIYVACLTAYNNGHLHGKWIDADQDPESLMEEITAMLKNSPAPGAEEWAIHGQEDFGELQLDESMALDKVSEMAAFLVEHGGLGAALLSHNYYGDIEGAKTALESSYYGEHDSEAAFVEAMVLETMEVPEHLQYYIDYQLMARDWFICDYFSLEANHKVHVFSCY